MEDYTEATERAYPPLSPVKKDIRLDIHITSYYNVYNELGRRVMKMRTNIVIDEELINKGIHYTGLRTKKELVNYALRELIQKKERKEILLLEGKLHWEELRRSRFNDPD
jgi:Arc/MetJ family transcription regulator